MCAEADTHFATKKRRATGSSTAQRHSGRSYAMPPVMDRAGRFSALLVLTPRFGDIKTISTLKHRECRKLEHVSAGSAVHECHISETLTHNSSHGMAKSAAIQYLL